jgi:hypothetical protein
MTFADRSSCYLFYVPCGTSLSRVRQKCMKQTSKQTSGMPQTRLFVQYSYYRFEIENKLMIGEYTLYSNVLKRRLYWCLQHNNRHHS